MTEELKGVYGALAEAAGEMKAIAKDQRNTQQNFDFRSIESIVGHAKPLLAKHSLAIVPVGFDVLSSEKVESSRGTSGWRTVVKGMWTIGHADGSTIQASMVGEAVDYGDKSASKAVQMAYKYMLTQLLGIGSEDPDGLSPEVVAAEEPAPDFTEQIREIVSEFEHWDEDEKRDAWVRATAELGRGKPKTIEDVEAIADKVREYYGEYIDLLPEPPNT